LKNGNLFNFSREATRTFFRFDVPFVKAVTPPAHKVPVSRLTDLETPKSLFSIS
jgi:hypothetical protein